MITIWQLVKLLLY